MKIIQILLSLKLNMMVKTIRTGFHYLKTCCLVTCWGEPERSPTLLSSMHSAVYIYISIHTTTRLLRMRQMFHVKHGVDAPPTTCNAIAKKKKATATDINGCSVARSIEVTMVGTARSIEITKSSYHGGSSPEY